MRDGRVLLCHRSPDREWYPDVWDLPGGHIEPAESAADAVARELLEELSITVEPPSDPPFAVIVTSDFDMQVWLLTAWVGDITNAAPAEHDYLAWYVASEVSALRFFHDSYPALIARALTQVSSGGSVPVGWCCSRWWCRWWRPQGRVPLSVLVGPPSAQ